MKTEQWEQSLRELTRPSNLFAKYWDKISAIEAIPQPIGAHFRVGAYDTKHTLGGFFEGGFF